MDVPAGVWISLIISSIIICWMTYWITNKAYSKRWDDNDNEKQGQFR